MLRSLIIYTGWSTVESEEMEAKEYLSVVTEARGLR
jgi:hypothetical protein